MIYERTITIEYLDQSMSKSLLCKFPDNSSFGFNYCESGIWSPLIPRKMNGFEVLKSSNKLTISKRKRKKNKKKKIDSSSKRLSFSPTPKKGLNRLLKAATKRFKAQRRAAIQMILPAL